MKPAEFTLQRIRTLLTSQQNGATPFNSREEKTLDQLLVRLSCTITPSTDSEALQQYLDVVPFLPVNQKAKVLPSLYGLVEKDLTRNSNQGENQKNELRAQLSEEFEELLKFAPLKLAWSPSYLQRLQFCLNFLETSIEEAEVILGKNKGIIPQCKDDLDALQRRILNSEESLDSQILQEVFRIRIKSSLKKLYDWLRSQLGYDRTKAVFDKNYDSLAQYYLTFREFRFLVEQVPAKMLDPTMLMALCYF